MAATRKKTQKVVGDSLDSFASNLSRLYTNQLAVRNTGLELDFQQKVAEGDLTLDDQLAYRKTQLSEVQDDPAEKTRLRTEMSALKVRIEQENFTQAYAAKLSSFQAGLSSIDSVISFLTQAQAGTTDTQILDTIASKIADANAQKFAITQDVIKNQTDYAINSKAIPSITEQITKVNSARATAVLNGNDDLVSVYDLQLQNLNQAKSNAQVNDQVLNLGAISATGAVDAVGLLNTLNSNISGASNESGPVTIGGDTYPSIAAFWTSKRDSYVSDQSANGFFGSLDTELKNNITTLSSKNALTTDSLASVSSVFNGLAARPELAPYQKQIDTYKQDVLQTGANAITQTITNQFNRDLNVGNAVASLNTLKALGVNVDSAYTQILQSSAATKSSQVQGILSAAQNAMQNDPNLTPEMAIQTALSAGAGTVLSPQDAAIKTEGQIATDSAAIAAAGKGTNDPRTTVPTTPTTLAPTTAATPNPTPTTPAAPTSYTIKYGDTLSQIAASHGTTVALIAQANGITDPNKIQAGATLKLPSAAAAPPTPVQSTPTITTPTPTVQAPVNPNPTPAPVTTQPKVTTPAPATSPDPTGLSVNGLAQYKNLISVGASQEAALNAARLVK